MLARWRIRRARRRTAAQQAVIVGRLWALVDEYEEIEKDFVPVMVIEMILNGDKI